MATGCMAGTDPYMKRTADCRRTIHALTAAVMAMAAPPALASEVTLVGVFPGRALVVIGGGAARTITTGTRSSGSAGSR